MSLIDNIISAIDDELERTKSDYLTPPEANKITDEKNILKNNLTRSGSPLRNLLRNGLIPHAYQVNGKWRIPHSKSNIEFNQSIINTGTEPLDNNVKLKNEKYSFKTILYILIIIIVIGGLIKLIYFQPNEISQIKNEPLLIIDTITKNGIATDYYRKTKKIAIQGKLINGIQDSIWDYYQEDGKLIKKISYENGVNEGISVFYDSAGIVTQKRNYKAGIPNGDDIYFFDDGLTIMSKRNFKNGKIEGKSYEYFPTGSISSITEWKNDKMDGKYIEYEEFTMNFTYYYVQIYGYYKDGLKDGEWKYYTYPLIKPNTVLEKHTLIKIENYKFGELNGRFLHYDRIENFKIIEGTYLNGKENGITKYYCPNGIDKGELYFLKTMQDGIVIRKSEYLCDCPNDF